MPYLIKENHCKCIHVVALNNWQPELCAITIPNLVAFAKRIGADFNLITEPKFPSFPPNYERFQIWEEGRNYDWNFNIDADTILSKDCMDPTTYVDPRHIASSWGIDTRHFFDVTKDPYFARYEHIWGVADQFTLSSILTHDFWMPTEMTFEEASKKCIKEARQVSEYILSRNMARFGLKHTGVFIDHSKHFTLMFTSSGISIEEAKIKLNDKLKEWGML